MAESLRRLFASVDGERCSFGCTYCFANFADYRVSVRLPTLAELESCPAPLSGIDVVYPACDTELFARHDAMEVLKRCAALGVSLSISTKAAIPQRWLAHIGWVAKEMRKRGTVLKIGVSITTVSLMSELEPRTPPYAVRLRTLRRLASAGVSTALVVRPLLPEVPPADIVKILDDARPFTRRVLFGDEWLGSVPRQPSTPAAGDMSESLEHVRWLPGSPMWTKRTAATLRRIVGAHAAEIGFLTFDTDDGLMRSILEEAAATAAVAPAANEVGL